MLAETEADINSATQRKRSRINKIIERAAVPGK